MPRGVYKRKKNSFQDFYLINGDAGEHTENYDLTGPYPSLDAAQGASERLAEADKEFILLQRIGRIEVKRHAKVIEEGGE